MIQEETSLEDPYALIQEYENLFSQFKRQIDLYEVEHESLKSEITRLIHENKSLSKNLKEIFKNKLENDITGNDIIENLKIQLKVLSEEKSATYDLWQNTLRTIDSLEEELMCYRGNSGVITKHQYDKEKQKYTLEIKELKDKLKLLMKQYEQKSKENLENLELRTNELSSALEEQRTAMVKIQEKETEIINLNERLNNIWNINEQLKNEISKQDEHIRILFAVDQISKEKVLESVIIAEEAIAEKKIALQNEAQAKEEVQEIKNTLAQIIQEADTKVEIELKSIKEQYNEKLNRLLEDLKSIQSELNDKTIKLDKSVRECILLEEEISRMKQGNITIDNSTTSKLLILEKNLESTFQKLLLSERKNAQIEAEKISLKMDLEQMQKQFEHDTKARELEIQNFERKIKTLENELLISNKYVEDYVIQIKVLNSKMLDMDEQMKSKLQSKEKFFDDKLIQKIDEINQKHIEIQKKLELHWNTEHQLNLKWQSETKDITDKLQARIMQLKAQNKDLLSLVESYQKIRSI